MIIHMFAFRWSPEATSNHRARAIEEIAAFEGKIPGLIECYVSANIKNSTAGYETGGMMKFADDSSYRSYNAHPLHQALLAWLSPLIQPIEIDLRISN